MAGERSDPLVVPLWQNRLAAKRIRAGHDGARRDPQNWAYQAEA